MELSINDTPVYLYTGGRPFDRQQPVVVLIHGAGHDHSVWNFQARQLAHHGFAVLAPDLPAHGRSQGSPLPTIEALADWVESLLDAAGVVHAALAGHSMGSLVALQAAAQAPERIRKLILIGSVAPMPVAPPLLEAAANARAVAHGMINQWSYTPASQLGASPIPGVSLTGLNQRLMERQREGVLANDLAACNAYQGGLEAASRIAVPCAMLCGERDQMTPRKAVKPLQEALAKVPGGARMIVIKGAGHAMMAEAPDAVGDAMRGFLTSA
ncbi:alpha/beta fold hydrolase [Aromatoleum evansii]|uniref:alpha/beta fold hydrolase n=1 Tax=Aromatoleum evansii TaxID=59406 RepID=UPI00145CD74B|nr:alpha/beta hydrolase [Aromatoleum evansii]NMG27502.1 alpha/beta fold hydrolase [Aromatoleum evansii]